MIKKWKGRNRWRKEIEFVKQRSHEGTGMEGQKLLKGKMHKSEVKGDKERDLTDNRL